MTRLKSVNEYAGFEMALSKQELDKYWGAAVVLRKNLDAAEYKHIVLGLVFLKYVSDAFEDRRAELESSFSDSESDRFKADPARREAALNERDYYREVNVFWVSEGSRCAAVSAAKVAEFVRASPATATRIFLSAFLPPCARR